MEEKSYLIKVPVYTSERKVDTKGVFGQTYNGMTSYIKEKVRVFNTEIGELTRSNRTKIKTTKIDSIEFIGVKIGEIESSLLKISAYTTNHTDGFVETEEKFQLKENHKVGSDTNFVLLYPIITGISSDKFKYHWLILIYEDPNKQNLELISNVKLVLRKALNIKIKNIKLPSLLEELKSRKTIPELSLSFTAYENGENEVDADLRPYLVKSRLTRQRKESFENLPLDQTEDLINDDNFNDGYNKKELKLTLGNKEYKISKELKEAQDRISSVVEEVFNSKIAIKETELDKIYNKDFIVEKLTDVVTNYISGTD